MLNGESNLAFSIIFYDKMHVYSGKIANFALKILKIPIINTLFMKKLLLFAIAVCVAFIAGATSYNMLNVHLADGTTVDVKLASDLKLTFTETHLVATGTGVSVEVPRESIAKFVHTFDAGSGIAEVAQDGMKFSGNTLSFDSLPAGSVVNVYTVAGSLVRSVAAEGAADVELDGLTAGVYVVTVNNVSYKITVK